MCHSLLTPLVDIMVVGVIWMETSLTYVRILNR